MMRLAESHKVSVFARAFRLPAVLGVFILSSPSLAFSSAEASYQGIIVYGDLGGSTADGMGDAENVPAQYNYHDLYVTAHSTTDSSNGGYAYASASSGGVEYAIAVSQVSYDISISGPSGVTVPLTASAITGFYSSSNHYYSEQDLEDQAESGGYIYSDATYNNVVGGFGVSGCLIFTPCNPYTPTYQSQIEHISLTSGTLYHVLLYADVSAYLSHGYAFIDPTFTIDPSYASSFSIVGVPDSANTSGAPEIATWIQMLIGFGAIGSLMRRIKLFEVCDPSVIRLHRFGND